MKVLHVKSVKDAFAALRQEPFSRPATGLYADVYDAPLVGKRKAALRARYIGVCSAEGLDQLILPTWLVVTSNGAATVRCTEATRKTPAHYFAWVGATPKGDHKELKMAVAATMTDQERKLLLGR